MEAAEAADAFPPGHQNAINLEPAELSPLRPSQVARSDKARAMRLQLALDLELPPNRFLTEEAFTEATHLHRTPSSGDRNNCMLNSTAQGLSLLDPTRAFDQDVCDLMQLWRCHLVQDSRHL